MLLPGVLIHLSIIRWNNLIFIHMSPLPWLPDLPLFAALFALPPLWWDWLGPSEGCRAIRSLHLHLLHMRVRARTHKHRDWREREVRFFPWCWFVFLILELDFLSSWSRSHFLTLSLLGALCTIHLDVWPWHGCTHTHTHPCTSIFVGTFTDVTYYPNPSADHPN